MITIPGLATGVIFEQVSGHAIFFDDTRHPHLSLFRNDGHIANALLLIGHDETPDADEKQADAGQARTGEAS